MTEFLINLNPNFIQLGMRVGKAGHRWTYARGQGKPRRRSYGEWWFVEAEPVYSYLVGPDHPLFDRCLAYYTTCELGVPSDELREEIAREA